MPTILVVEEGDAARDTLGGVFAAAAVEPVFVGSSRAALERYREGGIDLVLTEVRLPEMDGLRLTRKLRQEDPNAVIVCMTALERKNDLREAIRVGVFDFFVKPFAAGELTDSLRRAVAWREHLSAPRAAEPGPLLVETPPPDMEALADLEAREAAVAEREAQLERAVAEFEALEMGAAGSAAAPGSVGGGPDAAELDGRLAEIEEREAALAERESLLEEREAFLEQSENALFDKAQNLQELETELQHRADGSGVALQASTRELPAETGEQLAEIEARKTALDERERDLEQRFGKLLERERRLKKNEALVRAREQYLKESENILFEDED